MFVRLKKFWDNLETLEQKLFWIIQCVFIIVSVFGTILTVYESVNRAAELLCLANFVICVLVAIFVRKTGSYSIGFFIVIFYYSCLSSPLQFFFCGGTDSAVTYYLLVGPFLSSFIDNRRIRFFSAGLTTVVAVGVFLVAWCHQDWMSINPTLDIIYLDYVTNYVLVSVSIFLICSYAINAYVRERVQRERLMSKLDYQSKHDTLTELYNRRYVIQYLENIVWHSREKFYMFMFSIDDFKEVNETYGHVMGDRVICDVAHALWKCVNEEDGECGARYGEETFLYIIAADSDVDAFVRADEFRESIWNLSWSIDPRLRVTISGGIVPCRDENEFDRERLLKKVDSLLDNFKSRSRNQVRSLTD